MLKRLVRDTLASAWSDLDLPPAEPEVGPSLRPEFGDFSTNLALVGAKTAKTQARPLAERLAARIDRTWLDRVDVAGPGFVNLFLKPEAIHEALRRLLRRGETRTHVDAAPQRLQVEFVSSNPTGPLTVGHGRQAVLGDVLASLYEALGASVTREYYFNDEGRQVDLLAESLWVRYRQALGHAGAEGRDWPQPEPLPHPGAREDDVETAFMTNGAGDVLALVINWGDEPVEATLRVPSRFVHRPHNGRSVRPDGQVSALPLEWDAAGRLCAKLGPQEVAVVRLAGGR